MTRIHDAMFRGDSDGLSACCAKDSYRDGAVSKSSPRIGSVYDDQIVWGRSPVRIDIAGGWTDTPPYCLMEGGNVVNLAIELNGQPPLQAYVKPCREPHIILRSIDLGATEVVETNEQLADFKKVGSPFSIPKAALALAGFLTVLGTGSIHRLPAAGSLRLRHRADAALGHSCRQRTGHEQHSGSHGAGRAQRLLLAGWDKNEIGHRTLVLEQLLTTGGGWQDQFGGVLGGVKLLQTNRGFEQNPLVRWLPNDLYTQPEYAQCHLLYYTGITRTAKTILAEIVRRMFLNEHDQLRLLRQMRQHALDMYEAIQRQDFQQMGLAVRRTWQQNQQLDSGTNPPEVAALTTLVDDLCLGYKLPGAGGGGYLYMVAKDPEAAARIKADTQCPPSERQRPLRRHDALEDWLAGPLLLANSAMEFRTIVQIIPRPGSDRAHGPDAVRRVLLCRQHRAALREEEASCGGQSLRRDVQPRVGAAQRRAVSHLLDARYAAHGLVWCSSRWAPTTSIG